MQAFSVDPRQTRWWQCNSLTAEPVHAGRLLHKQGDRTDEMYIVVKGKLLVYQARQIPFGTTASEMRCSIWADLSQLMEQLVIQLGNQKDVAKHLQIKHPHRGVEFMQIIDILDLAIDAANSTTSSTQVTLRHDLEVSDKPVCSPVRHS